MTDITDSMARYIDNIPDGAVHTCSDLCIKAPCLIVRGKQEIERLRSRLAFLEGIEATARDENERRLAAEALLREVREDAPHFGMPTTRIDAFLTPDSASVEGDE